MGIYRKIRYSLVAYVVVVASIEQVYEVCCLSRKDMHENKKMLDKRCV
ncbi:MAG: hypothetical protein NVS4B12_02600 [Ktedonobacteraceae bacterium]